MYNKLWLLFFIVVSLLKFNVFCAIFTFPCLPELFAHAHKGRQELIVVYLPNLAPDSFPGLINNDGKCSFK